MAPSEGLSPPNIALPTPPPLLGRAIRSYWPLTAHRYLNHGAFGACPSPVLAVQRFWRDRLEENPQRFFLRTYPSALTYAKERLASFLGTSAERLVFCRNSTEGINGVLRSLSLPAGAEVLVSDHAYPACRLALEEISRDRGWTLRVASLPFPSAGAEELYDAFISALSPKTRLALVDDISSDSALRWPLKRIVSALRERGVQVIVDGAHGPGQRLLALDELDADWYVGNLHKWVCAPKGAAFLCCAERQRPHTAPATLSHGLRVQGEARLAALFDWTGTQDVTPWLSVPAALDFIASLHPDGWPGWIARNQRLARDGAALLRERYGLLNLCADEQLAMMLPVPLSPEGPSAEQSGGGLIMHPLERTLSERFGIEIPLKTWPPAPAPDPSARWLRFSAMGYTERADLEELLGCLEELGRLRRDHPRAK